MFVPVGEIIEEVEVLEDEAEVFAPVAGRLVLGQGTEVLAVEDRLAAGGLFQGGDDVQQGTLTGTGFPHDGHVLAVFNGEVNIL